MVMWWIAGAVAVIAIIAAILFYKRRKKKEKEMPQGIQIFDSGGNIIFDLSKSTTYMLGSGQTGTSNSSLSDSRIVAGRTWVIVTAAPDNALIPNFTVSNGSISWNFNTTASTSYGAVISNLSFIYGVF